MFYLLIESFLSDVFRVVIKSACEVKLLKNVLPWQA